MKRLLSVGAIVAVMAVMAACTPAAEAPLPTAAVLASPTDAPPTATATEMPVPTETALPTETPTLTSTFTETPIPVNSPTFTATVTPTQPTSTSPALVILTQTIVTVSPPANAGPATFVNTPTPMRQSGVVTIPTLDPDCPTLMAEPAPGAIEVVIAARRINSGLVIQPGMVRTYPMAAEDVPEDALTEASAAIGMIARDVITCGTPLTRDLLAGDVDDF